MRGDTSSPGGTASSGAGGGDAWLVRTDAAGKAIWSRTFGGAGIDGANCVQQAGDGGFVLAGWTTSFGSGKADASVIRTDSVGETVWHHAVGGSRSDMAYCIRETDEGGYVIAGWTEAFGSGAEDGWLVRLRARGWGNAQAGERLGV